MSLYEAFIVQNISAGSVLRIIAVNALIISLAFVLIHVVFRGFFARRRIQVRSIARRDLAREFVFSVSTLAVGAMAGMLTIYLVRHRVFSISYGSTGPAALALHGLLYFLGLDLYLYAVHRFLHLRPVFRRVHYLHHRSRTPNPLTAFSSHPVEAVLNSAFIPLSFWSLPVDAIAFSLVCAGTQVYTVLLHSGREPFPRWWLRSPATRWLATPLFHDLHHSRAEDHYGFYTTIWDRLFGTVAPSYAPAVASPDFPRTDRLPSGSSYDGRERPNVNAEVSTVGKTPETT